MPYCGLSESGRLLTTLTESTKINAQIARVVRQIELMKEYRARLIADVVTGKLDVRDAAANLPDDEGGGVATNRDSAVHYPGTEA